MEASAVTESGDSDRLVYRSRDERKMRRREAQLKTFGYTETLGASLRPGQYRVDAVLDGETGEVFHRLVWRPR